MIDAFKAFAKVPYKTDSLEAVSINLSIEKTKLLILGYAHKCILTKANEL